CKPIGRITHSWLAQCATDSHKKEGGPKTSLLHVPDRCLGQALVFGAGRRGLAWCDRRCCNAAAPCLGNGGGCCLDHRCGASFSRSSDRLSRSHCGCCLSTLRDHLLGVEIAGEDPARPTIGPVGSLEAELYGPLANPGSRLY